MQNGRIVAYAGHKLLDLERDGFLPTRLYIFVSMFETSKAGEILSFSLLISRWSGHILSLLCLNFFKKKKKKKIESYRDVDIFANAFLAKHNPADAISTAPHLRFPREIRDK